MSRPIFELLRSCGLAGVLVLGVVRVCVAQAVPQTSQPDPEVPALLQQGAIVHRRLTMLARRVQHDLAESRRFQAERRVACLTDVLSDLHSTQRGLEAWTKEVERTQPLTSRLRGMLLVFRRHLKELRAEAVGCFGVASDVRAEVRVRITGPQPDEDPSRVERPVTVDVPWAVPGR